MYEYLLLLLLLPYVSVNLSISVLIIVTVVLPLHVLIFLYYVFVLDTIDSRYIGQPCHVPRVEWLGIPPWDCLDGCCVPWVCGSGRDTVSHFFPLFAKKIFMIVYFLPMLSSCRLSMDIFCAVTR